MKKTVLIFVILTLNFALLTFNCAAQPNSGFENWSTVYGLQEPDNWQTLNFFANLTPSNPLCAFKATGVDKHSGNYALKVKTVFLNNNPLPQIFPDSIGLVFIGKLTNNPPGGKVGYPYSGRPEKLEFWAKYLPVGSDSGAIGVTLKKWNGLSSDTVAFGTLIIGPVAQYSFFQLNLNYRLPELADTAVIAISSSKDNGTVRIGSMLFIDDVAFTGWVGIDNHTAFADKLKIFPNPAKESVTISAHFEEADNVQVVDVSDKLAGNYKIQDYVAKINTSVFAEGIYFFEIRDKKNGILTKGKFNVVK